MGRSKPTDTIPSPARRRWWPFPAAKPRPGLPREWILLLGIATLLRVAHVASLAGGARFLLDGLLSDSRSYHEWAVDLARGTGSIPAPFSHAPGYPFALSLLYGLAGPSPLAAVVVQSLLGIATLVLTHRIAARVLGRDRALPAALLATLYAPLLWTEGKILTETLFVFVSLAAILVTLGLHGGVPAGGKRRRMGGKGFGSAFWAGLLWGLAADIRPIALLSVAGACLWVAVAGGGRPCGSRGECGEGTRASATPAHRTGAWRAVAAAGGLLLGAAAAVAPITACNAAAGDGRVLVSANAGINFWFGNQPGSRPSFLATDFRFGSFERQGFESQRLAEEAVGHPLLPSEASRYWLHRGSRSVVSDPAEALRREGRKLLAMISNFEYGVDGLPSVDRLFLPVLHATLVPFAAILALAALGLLARLREPRPTPGFSLLLLFLASHAAGILIFFHYSRFRLPMIPVLCILAAEGIRGAGTWMRHPRAGITAMVAAAALAATSLWVHPDDTHHLQEAGAHLYLAESLVHGEGSLDDASASLERCLSMGPASARSIHLQGVILEKRGDAAGARERYEAALRLSPTFPSPHVRLGRLLGSGRFGRGKALEEAIRHLERAMELGAYDPSLRVERAALLLESGHLDEAEEAFQALTGEEALSERAWFGVGECRRRRGDLNGAREAWRQGLRRHPGSDRLRGALQGLAGT